MHASISHNISLRLAFLFLAFLPGLLSAQTRKTLKTSPVGENVNSEFIEICPRLSADGKTMYFVRMNHPDNKDGGEGSLDIWSSKKDADGKWGAAFNIESALTNRENNAVLGVSIKNDTLILLNKYTPDGRTEQGFSYSVWSDTGWSFPRTLSIPSFYNESEFMSCYITPDQKTLFVEIQDENSRGGQDLYVCTRVSVDSAWSKPINMGDAINTAYDEITPFLSKDGRKLFFSSDRDGGMGDFDVYVSYRIGEGWDNWTRPQNMGSQLNTTGFDAYFIVSPDEKDAYLAVRNEGTRSNDIHTVVYKELTIPAIPKDDGRGKGGWDGTRPMVDRPDFTPPPGKGRGIKPVEPVDPVKPVDPEKTDNTEHPNKVPAGHSKIYGHVFDAETRLPIEGATVVFRRMPDQTEVGRLKTNAQGEYSIILPVDARYEFYVSADKYLPTTDFFVLTKEDDSHNVFRNVYLQPDAIQIKNVLFDFDKSTLRSDALIILNNLVKVLIDNPTMQVQISGHTDAVGTDAYNQVLSEQRANAVRQYLISKGAKAANITAVGYGESRHIAPNDTDHQRQLNRRVEFKIVKR